MNMGKDERLFETDALRRVAFRKLREIQIELANEDGGWHTKDVFETIWIMIALYVHELKDLDAWPNDETGFSASTVTNDFKLTLTIEWLDEVLTELSEMLSKDE